MWGTRTGADAHEDTTPDTVHRIIRRGPRIRVIDRRRTGSASTHVSAIFDSAANAGPSDRAAGRRRKTTGRRWRKTTRRSWGKSAARWRSADDSAPTRTRNNEPREAASANSGGADACAKDLRGYGTGTSGSKAGAFSPSALDRSASIRGNQSLGNTKPAPRPAPAARRAPAPRKN